jgi:hypothetical protein
MIILKCVLDKYDGVTGLDFTCLRAGRIVDMLMNEQQLHPEEGRS